MTTLTPRNDSWGVRAVTKSRNLLIASMNLRMTSIGMRFMMTNMRPAFSMSNPITNLSMKNLRRWIRNPVHHISGLKEHVFNGIHQMVKSSHRWLPVYSEPTGARWVPEAVPTNMCAKQEPQLQFSTEPLFSDKALHHHFRSLSDLTIPCGRVINQYASAHCSWGGSWYWFSIDAGYTHLFEQDTCMRTIRHRR